MNWALSSFNCLLFQSIFLFCDCCSNNGLVTVIIIRITDWLICFNSVIGHSSISEYTHNKPNYKQKITTQSYKYKQPNNTIITGVTHSWKDCHGTQKHSETNINQPRWCFVSKNLWQNAVLGRIVDIWWGGHLDTDCSIRGSQLFWQICTFCSCIKLHYYLKMAA